MRRYTRTLILIAALITIAAASIAVQHINISFLGGQFTRGSNAPLGLRLGLDLQGGSHLVYQARKDVVVAFNEAVSVDQVKAALVDQEKKGVEVERQEDGSFVVRLTSLQKEDEDAIRQTIEVKIGNIKSFSVTPDPTTDQMEGVVATIERRVNAFGVTEPTIQLMGSNRVLVQLPDIKIEEAKKLIGQTATLEFKERTFNVIQDLKIPLQDIVSAVPEESSTTKGGVALNIVFKPGTAKSFKEFVVRLTENNQNSGKAGEPPDLLAVTVAGSQTKSFEVVGIQVESKEDDRFLIQLPGLTSVDEAKKIFGDTPSFRFDEHFFKVDTPLGLTGSDLARAFPGQAQTTNQPVVNIQFNSRGAAIFADVTRRIAGTQSQIAIFLDNKELLSPVVRQAITGGSAFIEGPDFTLDRVRTVAIQLESGRLPVPIEVIQERSVDATLGKDSLNKSVIAGLVGLSMVLLFMIINYRLAGVVASMALILYAVLVLAIFKLWPVTLTVSGVAAFILSIGMAVDANILIFERMKEEIRAGRTLGSAITEGFNRAWTSIRDSNVSTMITCGILFWFGNQLGASIVQGFALTLFIGVLVSMFSAITVSRNLLRILAATPAGKHIKLLMPVQGRVAERPRRTVSERISA